MDNSILEKLLSNGDIVSYHRTLRDEDGVSIEQTKGSRETESLVLTFPSGIKLSIDTFCSGSLENTLLLISQV